MPTSEARTSEEVIIWSSEELLKDANEVVILHGEERYRLIKTKNNKLIMQK
jgi:hemin uptake protein HemP